MVSVRSVDAPVQVCPFDAVTPLTVPEKFAAVSEPPLLLTTTFLMIRCAGVLVFVIVQVLVSPLMMVPEQPE